MSKMKVRFIKYSKHNTLMSILMALLGVVLLLWPGTTLSVMAHILGIALLVGAAVSGFAWYKDREKPGATFASLAYAVLCAILGIVVLSAPEGIITLLPKLIGIAIIINGAVNLAQALELRGVGHAGWTSSLAMAVLTLALGAFLVFFAFSAMKAAVMVVGGIFIFNGASNLWIESRYKKMGR